MLSRRCSLLPLGSLGGDEGLNSWEHIAFSEWLENHVMPGDEDLEKQNQVAFEKEFEYWEEVTYRLPFASALDTSELTDLEDDCLEEEFYD